MDPILKWAGGKRRLIPEIILRFPSNYKKINYHEPFFGGGAVFFKITPEKGSINDINVKLMNFYEVVRDNPQELIEMASKYSYDEEEYYRNRYRFNDSSILKIESAALLLYLNKTAFNGLYRENSKGEFNVPFGKYKNPTIVPKKKILAASYFLKKINILCKDFSYVLDYAEEGDLCYFDPPYEPISHTSDFTSYSSDGFNYKEQIRLRDVCIELDNKKVYFILSNSYNLKIIELYDGVESFRIEEVINNRMISSKASTRGKIKEILVTNIPIEMTRKYKLYGFY